jgi:hypothetical protein
VVEHPKLEGLNPALPGTGRGKIVGIFLNLLATCGSSKVVEHPKLEGLYPALPGTGRGKIVGTFLNLLPVVVAQW